MKCIKNKVQSLINKLHRSYRFTILHVPYLKSNCTTSTYLNDYINVHTLNSADDCLRVLSKSTNSQRYTAVTGWLTQSNLHTRGATTLNVTRHLPHNIAVTHKQHKILLRSSKTTRRINAQLPIRLPYISYIPYILSYINHTMPYIIYTFSARIRATAKRFY